MKRATSSKMWAKSTKKIEPTSILSSLSLKHQPNMHMQLNKAKEGHKVETFSANKVKIQKGMILYRQDSCHKEG